MKFAATIWIFYNFQVQKKIVFVKTTHEIMVNKNKNASSEMILSHCTGCWSGQQICAGKSRPLKISSVNRWWAYGQVKIARGCFCYCRTLKLFSLKILDTGRLYVFNNNISSLNISTGVLYLRGFLRLWKNNRISRKLCKRRSDLVLNGLMRVPK